MIQDGIYHVPVLLNEVIEQLQIIPEGIYVDCTFGGGGHSKRILEQLNEQGRLFVFDQDKDAEKNVPDDKRVTFVPHNFRHLQRMLRLHKYRKSMVFWRILAFPVTRSMYQNEDFQPGLMLCWICA